MPRKSAGAWKGDLPALELECMKVLWDGAEMSVRDVRERLWGGRPLAYTTVLTLLDRLTRKGAASRRKVGRAHVYQAAYPRAAARERAVARLLENFFGGSQTLLLEHLGAASPRSAAAAAAGHTSPSEGPAAQPADLLDPTLL